MPDQIGYFSSLKNVAGKVFTYLASITLAGTDGKTITCTQDTSLDEAVAMSSKLTIPGAWTTPAFNAGDFTGQTLTWTVEAADVVTYRYIIIGKMMTVSWAIHTTSVSGSAGPRLLIKIPAGKTATKSMRSIAENYDNSVTSFGSCEVVAGETNISIAKDAAVGNWTASTNVTYTFGQMTFEIN